MRLTIIGTHGLPAKYGGFETFVSHLAVACAREGIRIRVINEKNNPVKPLPENVEVISSAYNKGKSTLKFYKDSLKLASKDSDLILCCGVGGSYYYPSFKNSHVKIITNVDGMEHQRRKYSMLQRMAVYYLQKKAAKNSDFLIADSAEIWGYWTSRFPLNRKNMKVISYGADDCLPFNPSVLDNYKLKKNEYFLVIARLVPENMIEEIIIAFSKYIGSKQLVIVGDDEKTSYTAKLKQLANSKTIFTGAIYDKSTLDSLRQGCFMYIHGHSVGGTNPSLLEAMAAGCACLCHDNVFNLEVTEGTQVYFHSSYDLSILLNLLEHKNHDFETMKQKSLERIKTEYNWEKVYSLYINLFKKLHDSGKRSNVR